VIDVPYLGGFLMRSFASFASLAASLVALLFGAVEPADAQTTRTWTSLGGTAFNWSDPNHWSPVGVPQNGDTLVFNGPITSNANLGPSVAIAAIVFNSGGAVVNGAVTINAAAATINIDDRSTGGLTVEINASIAITGADLFIKSGAGRRLALYGSISGSQPVRIYGPGEVEFGMAGNTYTGTTTVASADSNGGSGVLRLSGVSATVVPGNLNIGSGTGAPNTARVQLVGVFGQPISDSSRVTIASDGLLDLGGLSETVAQIRGTGNIAIPGSGNLNVGDAGDFTWGGVISNTGSVNKVGTGAMTLTAANTYTGATTVSRGALVLGTPSGTRAIATASPITIGNGSGSSGAAILRNTNSSQINRSGGGALTIQSDGQYELADFQDALSAININGGNISMLLGSIQINGDVNMNGGSISGGTLGFRSNAMSATSSASFGQARIGASIEIEGDRAFVVTQGALQPELRITGRIVNAAGGAGNLVKSGGGTLRLAGGEPNAYGGTTIERGVLELAKSDNVVAITGPIVIGNNTDPPGSATLKNLANFQIGGKPTMTINASGVYDVNSSGTGAPGFDVIGGLSGTGLLRLPNSSNLRIDIASGSASFAGSINSVSSTLASIDKFGAGGQVFTGNGTGFTGQLSVNGGQFTINAPGELNGRVFVGGAGPGELRGNGRIGDLSVSSGGSVRPGNGNGGTLTTANANFSGNTTLIIDLASASAGGFGKLAVNGSVTIDSFAFLELLPVAGFALAANAVIEIVGNDGADPISGRFVNFPRNLIFPMGARNIAFSYTGGDGNDITLSERSTLDIDGDGSYLAETDGLLIARYINGLRGPALTTNALAFDAGAQRFDVTDIVGYLNHISPSLDINQSSLLGTTDSVLILRYLFGFRGLSLVAGLPVPSGFTPQTFASAVETRLAALTP
jgi:fibronectin-binding autotransporter adhesin